MALFGPARLQNLQPAGAHLQGQAHDILWFKNILSWLWRGFHRVIQM